MRELVRIIEGYEQAKKEGKAMALATVVQVDGSAYRRPGARMLVTEDGQLTGAISGGCLEGDALRKAQAVIFQQKSRVVTYDTTDEDDQKFGVGLGCNGIIHLLIEPLDNEQPENPIALIKKALARREPALLLTIFSLNQPLEAQIGTVYLRQGALNFGSLAKVPEALEAQILKELSTKEFSSSQLYSYSEVNNLSVFFELISPTLRILLFGAGNDTIPLAQLATILGHELVLIDGRKALATQQRFPSAINIIQGPAEEVCQQLETDSATVALLMTHNFEYEAVVLEHLLPLELLYIGVLGPKRKTGKLLQRLATKGLKPSTNKLYAPVGLDLGAETSEEIALAILAEIAAVLRKKQAGSLRDKQGPIHGTSV